jgi:hypothetical protein
MQEVEQRREQLPTTAGMQEVEQRRETQGAVADDCRDAGGRATQGAVADDCRDAGGRATQGAVVDDCRDAGGRATQDAAAAVELRPEQRSRGTGYAEDSNISFCPRLGVCASCALYTDTGHRPTLQITTCKQ